MILAGQDEIPKPLRIQIFSILVGQDSSKNSKNIGIGLVILQARTKKTNDGLTIGNKKPSLKREERFMRILSSVILASSMAVSTLSSYGADLNDVTLGHPGHAGTGCPSDTVSAVLSPDKKSLSILFDDYQVEAGPSVGKKMDRKNCTLGIPVHIPNGFSVSLIGVDYRGYNYLPSRKASAVFSAEYFFAGIRGPRFTKRFKGMMDDEYILTNKLAVVAQTWSKCGEDVNLRIATAMRLRNMDRHEDALSTVDSVDLK